VRRGVDITLPFWGPRGLVLSIEVVPYVGAIPDDSGCLGANATLTSSLDLERAPVVQQVAPDVIKAADPFIYNPRNRASASGQVQSPNDHSPLLELCETDDQRYQAVLVQDEVAEFVVTLRNPFHFELELDNLVLRYDLRCPSFWAVVRD
jgi:hypothetical protein